MKALMSLILCTVLTACGGDEPVRPTACGNDPGVTPSSSILSVGDTIRLRASPLFDCAGTGPHVARWHSSSAAVAIVDSVTGLVTARASGTATIIASATDNPALAAAGLVQVK
jgi:uncharacterized protein YjdB